MCGRFSFGASAPLSSGSVTRGKLPAYSPPDNFAPTQEVLVVHQSTPHTRREAGLFRWRLISAWVADPSIGSRLI